MNKSWNWFQWLFVLTIVLLSLISGLQDDREVKQILERVEYANDNLNFEVDQSSEQNGSVSSNDRSWSFSTTQLRRSVSNIPDNRKHRFYTWSGNGHREITGSASGVDKRPYFANSFLVGFKPFDTNTVWEPLAILALRKSYVLDQNMYGPLYSEIWQNSRQAYHYSRGDCEDHAIILADWLISMGHKARVVLGKYNGGGHAWVVLFKDNREYILESTTKRRPRSISDFRLASLATEYQPMYQFDRVNFWVNTGSKHTTRYNDKKWHSRASYSPLH